jgi:hypothetical protein
MTSPDALEGERPRLFDGNRFAVLFLVVCSTLAAIGGLLEWDQEQNNEWQARFLAGKPVAVSFICGTDNPFDCKSAYEVSYSLRPKLCEHVRINGGFDRTGWCNGDPSNGTFSIMGAVFHFDRFGVVRLSSKLVGQLSVARRSVFRRLIGLLPRYW